ncbi:MAG TPA: helix-turn-helix transcriptional regulator [Solirubrobacterales bacterium]|nr:helix-turn-helix transcriptional regulator [Solirubrobacterales bacterium]
MAKTPSEAFGQALRQIRAEKDLSQEDAALKIGIDRAYYGALERAVKSPTLKMIWKIADPLGLPPSALLRRAEKLLED